MRLAHFFQDIVLPKLTSKADKFFYCRLKLLSMITRPQILSLILNRLRILGEELNKPNLTKSNEQTRLFGDKADLDSMGLVTLIADLEDDLQKQLGRPVTLVDEKAMSRLTSPFRRVDYLADYLVELLNTPQS